jgi:hypothetical protein
MKVPVISIELDQYIEREIQHIDSKYNIILSKNSEALLEAKKEMERRLEGMNEFREQLEKQTSSFISRDEFTITERLLLQKIESLQRMVNVGLGVCMVLQVVIGFVLTFIFRFIVKV